MNHPRFAHGCRTTLGPFTVLMAVLMLALPTASFAQTVTPADLVGSWVRQGEKEVRFTFRADSTLTAPAGTNAGRGTGTGRWRLVGDTLLISNYAVAVRGQKVSAKLDRRMVTIKDKLLTLTRIDNGEQGPKARVYEQVDSLTVAPPKP